jgi:hypothetical protein
MRRLFVLPSRLQPTAHGFDPTPLVFGIENKRLILKYSKHETYCAHKTLVFNGMRGVAQSIQIKWFTEMMLSAYF